MKKITLTLLLALWSVFNYGQLALEDFESAWTGSPAAPPGGWAVYNQAGNITWVQSPLGNTSIPPHEGSYAAYLNRENVNPGVPIPTNWLITPQFNSPSNGLLHFYSRLIYPGDNGTVFKIKIATITDPTVAVEDLQWVDLVPPLSELELNPLQQQYVEKMIDIPTSYVGQQIRIAFIMQGDNQERWLIDDVEVISKCDPPATLTAANITLTTADLSWTSPVGVEEWEIEFIEELSIPTGNGQLYNGPLPYHKTDLVSGTEYKYYVRCHCPDGGKSIWVGPYHFRTAAIGEKCDIPLVIPNDVPLPYVTTNNTGNFGDNYEGTPGTMCNASGNYLAGNDVVYSYTPTTSGLTNINLSNTGGNAGVFVYNSCSTIGISCLAGGIASSTTAGIIPALPVTANTTYYIVISSNGTPQVTPYKLTLQQGYCDAPTGLSANGQTATSAQLSWAAGNATAWQLVVQPAGTGLPTGAGQNVTLNTNITVSSTTSGAAFTSATPYEYYVRSNCNNGTYSTWSGPFAFSTTQVPVDLEYSQNFDGPDAHGFTINNGTQVNKWYVGIATSKSAPNSLYISSDNGVSNNYIITSASAVHAYRDIKIPAGADKISISFDLKAGGQNATDYVRVWLIPSSVVPTPGIPLTPQNNGGGVQVGGDFNLTPQWVTQNTVVNVSTMGSTTRRLVFEWRNDAFTGAQPSGAIDNLNVKVISCPPPTALVLGPITSNSVTLNWTAPAGTAPAGYEYYYSQSLAAGPTTTTVPSGPAVTITTTTIPALNPSETYYFWVRSSCGTNNKSFWTGPLTVVMPQIPATLNYSQNFDNGSHGWSLNNGTQTNKWVVGSAVSNSPANSLYISNDNGITNGYETSLTSVTQAYRDILIPGDAGEITVNFDYKVAGEANSDYIRVWMVPATFVPTPGTPITTAAAGANAIQLGGNHHSAPNWTTVSYDTPVFTYQNQYRRLVFEWINNGIGGTQPPGAIDNIAINVIPCPKPQNLTAINVSNTNATLDWIEPGAATSWEVAYMPAAGATAPTTPGIPVATSEYTPPVGTFVYGIQYVYYVRSICGGTDASKWAGPFAFALKPLNDDCSAPTTILTNPALVCTNTANGSLSGATSSIQANTCGGTADDDVWFEFVATNTAHVFTLSNIVGTTGVLYHAVYSGNCNALTQVVCGTLNNTSTSTNFVVGQTYKVRVWTSANTVTNTTFKLCITTPPPPPVNDACSGALTVPVNPTLTCTDSTPGTIYSATASPELSTTCTGTKDDDVWFKFTATNTIHLINIINITGSTNVLYFAVYTGSDCSTLALQYCSPSVLGWANNLTVGQNYYIRVYTFTATPGQTSAFNVCVSTPPPPPVNDECAGAITVPINPTMTCANIVEGTVLSATASNEVNSCGTTLVTTSDNDDVWYEFTATSTAHVIEFKNIDGSSTDIDYAVYKGNVCGSLTQLYCSDPNYSVATGLTIGDVYKIRVWTKTTAENQTTTFQLCVSTLPPPPTNDECANAIVLPVNQNSNCTLTTTASVYAATASAEANTCGGDDADDVWFEFTATHTNHLISMSNIIGSTADLFHVLYAGDQCSSLTQLYCSDLNSSVASGLTVGNVYKIRVYTNTAATDQTSQFDICVRVPNTPIVVNDNIYTPEELVNEVLINSECAIVSNVTSRSGSDFGDAQSIAYFDANGATFPFSYGVVMSTGAAQLAPGPYSGTNTAAGLLEWIGDSDLSEIIGINNPNQTNSNTFNATVLEFDFIPLTNKFSFDFLFASTEYGTYQCGFSDVFAFILTDQNGNSKNLAVIPNTNIPVSVVNIRDGQYNSSCGSQNVEYFGQYNVDTPAAAAINFNGQTIPMTAESIVTPGASYHIKLAIADGQNLSYSSAIFLGGGTFDVGELDMGGDLLVSTQTALCDTQTKILDTGLVGSQYNYSWFKNGTQIPDATESTYEVTTPGTYGVVVTIDNVTCSYEGIVVVEFYTPINELTGNPITLTQCDASGFHAFDITPNLDALVALPTDPENFTTTVHLSESDAKTGDNPLDPSTYTAFTNTVEDLQTLWTRTVYSVTGCIGIKSFDLIVQDLTPQFTIDSDFSICEGTSDTIEVVITDTDTTPVTYTWTKDGAPLADTTPSITVTEAGAYTVVLDRTGCTATATVDVVVIPTPIADAPANVTVCSSYVLPVLSANNTYYNATTNDVVAAGTEITATTTFNIVASSGTIPECTSQNTFTVTVDNTFTLPEIDDVNACNTYELPELTLGNYYTAQGATGTMLHAGDDITATQTIYVYAETGGVPNCTAETSFTVTINASPVADAPADVNSCDNYTLTALNPGNTYWTQPNGTGEQLPVGYLVEHSMEIFVLAQTATTPDCTDQKSFKVNITPTPAFTLGGPYDACSASNLTISVANANFNDSDATYAWTLDGAPIAGTSSSIVASAFGTYGLTVTVNNCSHTESVKATQNTDAIPVIITEGCVDGVYMLGVTDENGSFDTNTATYAWTGPGEFTSTQREFKAPYEGEYFVTVTTAEGCIGGESYIVTGTGCDIQRGISPNGDDKNDYFDLEELDVKYLSIFNRYGQEVYNKNNYKNEWVGQTNKGDELPTGTYFYMIEFNSGESKTGWIYINRQD